MPVIAYATDRTLLHIPGIPWSRRDIISTRQYSLVCLVLHLFSLAPVQRPPRIDLDRTQDPRHGLLSICSLKVFHPIMKSNFPCSEPSSLFCPVLPFPDNSGVPNGLFRRDCVDGLMLVCLNKARRSRSMCPCVWNPTTFQPRQAPSFCCLAYICFCCS